MASELGASVKTAKRAALLHDLGKAMTHEVEGSHALISAQQAKRYGESQGVVHAIEAHLRGAAANRGGGPRDRGGCDLGVTAWCARRGLEHYIERLELEQLASSRKGVERVYALQAGREVRVMVKPTDVTDDEAVRSRTRSRGRSSPRWSTRVRSR